MAFSGVPTTNYLNRLTFGKIRDGVMFYGA